MGGRVIVEMMGKPPGDLPTKVARFLYETGYVPGDGRGIALDTLTLEEFGARSDSLSIIKQRFRLFGRRPRLGRIRFRDSFWALEVYGRKNCEELRLLAEKLAQAFDVDVKIKLEYTWVVVEAFADDGP